MKLIELMELITDNTNVALFDANEEHQLAEYDGRDSIPNEYNECKIIAVWNNRYELCIEIDA